MFFPPNEALKATRTWMRASQAYTKMLLTAGQVIQARTAQMALGTMKPEEAVRMVLEKPAAFAKSAEMAARAQAAAKGNAAVALAALTPIGAKTNANAKRLGRKRR